MLMVKQQVNDYDYDYDDRINRHLSKCKEVLSESDYTLVGKYHTQMIITSLAVATQSKNLEIIASLSSMEKMITNCNACLKDDFDYCLNYGICSNFPSKPILNLQQNIKDVKNQTNDFTDDWNEQSNAIDP
jgi:hypothetical protein